MNQATQHFFSRCRDPFAVSGVITSMAAGVQLQAARLPTDVLPSVVLLATIGLRTYEQQIVDDYGLLLERMEQTFKDPATTHRDFDHPDLWLVSQVSQLGPRGEYFLDVQPEAGYMFAAYEELINADAEQLFAWQGKQVQDTYVPAATEAGQQPEPAGEAQSNGKKKKQHRAKK